jgi:hypothetical protein
MLRTKTDLPKYCSWNVDQHGKRRVRFRKGGRLKLLVKFKY